MTWKKLDKDLPFPDRNICHTGWAAEIAIGVVVAGGVKSIARSSGARTAANCRAGIDTGVLRPAAEDSIYRSVRNHRLIWWKPCLQ